jgi:hypothetical protein
VHLGAVAVGVPGVAGGAELDRHPYLWVFKIKRPQSLELLRRQ